LALRFRSLAVAARASLAWRLFSFGVAIMRNNSKSEAALGIAKRISVDDPIGQREEPVGRDACFSRRQRFLPLVFVAFCVSVENSAEAQSPAPVEKSRTQIAIRYPKYVGEFDLRTNQDLYYSHVLLPAIKGDEIKDWPLLSEAKKTIGDFLDAEKIVGEILTSMPVGGNKPLAKIELLVDDCAKILGMPKPDVFIHNSPEVRAYSLGAESPHQLVLTKGMLDLFEKSPDEFRFIVGRELGHIKCEHLQMRRVALAVLWVVSRVQETALPVASLLPPLAFGRFCSWCREAEVSADRAGLLCCQDPQTAYNALSRLLHGLRADSDWIDPNNRDFDPEKIVKDFRAWEGRPFVEFMKGMGKSPDQPFIAERLAALKFWADSGAFRAILYRKDAPPNNLKVEIKAIMVDELCPEGKTVDTYLRIIQREKIRVETIKQDNVRAAAWADVGTPFDCEDGEPVFVEIWDSRLLSTVRGDSLIGLFAIYPRRGQSVYKAGIQWDVLERNTTVRAGTGKVKIAFLREDK
jgi:Zn-dependent protease with chaperone function